MAAYKEAFISCSWRQGKKNKKQKKPENLAQKLILIVAESLLEKVELSVFPTKNVSVIDSWSKRVRP